MSSFLKTALKTFKTSGTVRPSSPWLVRKLIQNIDFSQDLVLVEFGTGDGVVTLEIAERMSANSKLYALEINPDFYKLTVAKLAEYPNVQILFLSAFEVEQMLKEEGINEVDNFISSLPLSLFKDSDSEDFLHTCYQYLKPGHSYSQYQYTLGKYKMLRHIFDRVKVDFTFRNLPPAFIYTCFKSDTPST